MYRSTFDTLADDTGSELHVELFRPTNERQAPGTRREIEACQHPVVYTQENFIRNNYDRLIT